MFRLIGLVSFWVIFVYLALVFIGQANACPSVCLRDGNTMCDMACASRVTAYEDHQRQSDYRMNEWRKQLLAPTALERMVIREMPGTTFQHPQPRYHFRDRYDR